MMIWNMCCLLYLSWCWGSILPLEKMFLSMVWPVLWNCISISDTSWKQNPWYILDYWCLWMTSSHDSIHYIYLRSYLPQETMAMSLMYECSPSVDHDIYKILTATRIAIDINYPSLQIPTSCYYFDVKDWSCKGIRGFSLWSDLLVKIWCQW